MATHASILKSPPLRQNIWKKTFQTLDWECSVIFSLKRLTLGLTSFFLFEPKVHALTSRTQNNHKLNSSNKFLESMILGKKFQRFYFSQQPRKSGTFNLSHGNRVPRDALAREGRRLWWPDKKWNFVRLRRKQSTRKYIIRFSVWSFGEQSVVFSFILFVLLIATCDTQTNENWNSKWCRNKWMRSMRIRLGAARARTLARKCYGRAACEDATLSQLINYTMIQ